MEKYIFSKPKSNFWRIFTVVFIGIALVAGGGIWYLLQPVNPGDKEAIFVEVAKNEAGNSIIAKLKNENLIKSELVFKLYAKLTGNTAAIKSGYYKFNRSESTTEIAGKLFAGSVYTMSLTIPEGFTILDIANKLEQTKIVKKADFLAKTQDMARWKAKYKFLEDWKATSLEGFLFPDTYDIVASDDISENLVDMMLQNFSKKIVPLLATEKDPQKILIMASIVERESVLEKEKTVIASVFYNRIKKGMQLQSCATVDYALGRHTTNRALTIEETKTQSPFNTYVVKGLPPTPIANPGLSSVMAALKPDTTNYLFFVARGDGTSIFTATAAEHVKAMKESTIK